MLKTDALSLTSHVLNWLAESRFPRVLHVFDRACNLINERRAVLSIVTPEIGNGPFNLVVEDEILLSDYIDMETSLSVSPDQIIFDNLAIHVTGAKLWNPRPDWARLHVNRKEIAKQLSHSLIGHPLPTAPLVETLVSSLCIAFVNADLSRVKNVTIKLAGLGIGLTPSGDDFLIGALYAAWIVHPHDVAGLLAREVSDMAAPLTTSLSAAWLRSAGRGEAASLWHEFFEALLSADVMQSRQAMERIGAVGETSGTDALAGFLHTFASYIENSAYTD